MVSVVCPYCNQNYDLPDDYVGCKVACDNCEGRFFILDMTGRTKAAYRKDQNKDLNNQTALQCPKCQARLNHSDNIKFCSLCGAEIEKYYSSSDYFNKIRDTVSNTVDNLSGEKSKKLIAYIKSSSKLFKIFTGILLFSTVFFIFNAIAAINAEGKIENLEAEYKVLVADYKHKTSWSSFGNALIKSVFDGLTLGVFAEEGLYTEANRWDRNINKARNQEAYIQYWLNIYKKKYNSATSGVYMFLGLMLISSIVLAVDYLKKQEKSIKNMDKCKGLPIGNNFYDM